MASDGSVVIDINADDSDAKSKLKGLKDVVGNAMKGVAVASAAAGAAVVALGKQAISAYADYEQLVGGVDTLFKESASIVSEYAANAYKTAGVSANAYMETITSFSAGLLQSLGGDTEAAAQVADMAITDMADNANKMGSSMESIQMAYQGFAKQNYTMLDNLKLGYGGTKTEMERLLADAEKLSGVKYDISSLNDVYEAIHVIQGELGITGTTALEASTTLQGSAASMKAAWDNLLAGLADDNQDFDLLLGNLIDSAGTFAENLIPRVEIALGGIAELVAKAVPQIAAILPGLASDLLPEITEIAVSIVQNLTDGLSGNLPRLSESAVQIVTALASGIISILPQLAITAVQLITALAGGIAEALPTLIPAAVEAAITLARGLVDSLPEIISAAAQLIQGLTDGLIAATPIVVEALPDIITSLVAALAEGIPLLVQAGWSLLTALIQAWPEVIPVIAEVIPAVTGGIADAIINSLPIIAQAGFDLLAALVEKLPEIITRIAEAIPYIIAHISLVLQEAIPQIIQVGIMLFTSLVEALPEIITSIVEAIPQIIDAVVTAVLENVPLLVQAGLDLFIALIGALPEIIIAIVEAVPQIVNHIVSAIIGNIGEINRAGVQLFISLIKELPTIIKEIVKAVPQIVNGIVQGFLHQAQAFVNIGKDIVSGVWQGISNMAGWIKEKVKGFFSGVVDGVKGLLGIQSPSKVFAEIGGYTMEGFAVGVSRGAKEAESRVEKAARELSESILSAATAWVADKKDLHDLAAKDELAFWEEVKSISGLKGKELAAIDKKIYAARANASKEAFEHSKKWIENEKFYNRLSAEDEVAAWERVVARKNLANEEQLEAERGLYTARQALLKEQQAAEQALTEEYVRAVKDRADSLRSFAGLFDEVEKASDITGKQLLKNLRDQVSTFEKWQSDMGALAERGILSDALLKELADMGPKAASQIRELTRLTDQELEEYTALFAQKGQMAAEQAVKEIPPVNVPLDVAVTVTGDQESAVQTGTALVAAVSEGAEAAVETIVQAAATTVTSFCQTIQSRHREFYSVGQAAMDGLNEGLRMQGQRAIATARSIANAIIAEMRRAMDIHSPSRKMRDLVGKPAAQGFVLGFTDEMENFHHQMQAAVDRETGRISATIAAQADGSVSAEGIIKEVHTTNRVVEKIAHVEGEGISGELVRMLGLRFRMEDRRTGLSFAPA